MTGKYILVDKKVVPENDSLTWGRWFQTGNRHVASDRINKDVKVSTVFLGIDHSFDGGKLEIFETMIFGGEHDGYTERYSTWDEAEAGHAVAKKLAEGTT